MLQSAGVQIVRIILLLLQAYSFVIFFRIILSYFISPTNTFLQFLRFLTEPVLEPVRKWLEPFRRNNSIPFDFSPIIVMILISVISMIISQIFSV